MCVGHVCLRCGSSATRTTPLAILKSWWQRRQARDLRRSASRSGTRCASSHAWMLRYECITPRVVCRLQTFSHTVPYTLAEMMSVCCLTDFIIMRPSVVHSNTGGLLARSGALNQSFLALRSAPSFAPSPHIADTLLLHALGLQRPRHSVRL